MAGDWIKMRVDLAEDPAVISMARVLNIDEYGVVGRLQKIWSWADKHCSVGHAKGVTLVWINRYIGHDGFAESMVSEGWLVVADDGISFPKFDRHNGKSAKVRAEASERKRLERSRDENDADMSQKKRDKGVTREEKRREELTPTTSDEVVVASDAGNHQCAATDKPDCPHGKIVALYHEVLPMCPPVRSWTTARAQQLRTRWNEDKSRQSLDYWRRFFEYVKTCPFLVGAAPPTPGRQPFIADLEWMTKSSNFTKIREQRYEQ